MIDLIVDFDREDLKKKKTKTKMLLLLLLLVKILDKEHSTVVEMVNEL